MTSCRARPWPSGKCREEKLFFFRGREGGIPGSLSLLLLLCLQSRRVFPGGRQAGREAGYSSAIRKVYISQDK